MFLCSDSFKLGKYYCSFTIYCTAMVGFKGFCSGMTMYLSLTTDPMLVCSSVIRSVQRQFRSIKKFTTIIQKCLKLLYHMHLVGILVTYYKILFFT